MVRYVEYGFGSLGEVISETPRTSRRPVGVNVLPLNTGSGDAFGLATVWYPAANVRDADMSLWRYDTAHNIYRRINTAPAA